MPKIPGTLAHYRIVELIGAGGMGEVYRAEDTVLKRQVALKVLPPAAADSDDRLQRFRREAEALAALSHPNIVTIHSIEEAAGIRFLTMELVEGKPVSDLIPPGGMSLAQIFEIAIPLAGALAAAHARGIVHRDLKPGNLVLGDTGLRVLDFGLAKLRPEMAAPVATDLPTEELTRAGRTPGTLPYMAPEQLESGEIDPRTDIFALGVVLFELATGERPFRGDSAAAVAAAILRDVPADVESVRPDLPNQLGRIVRHCLEKEPRRRFQSALDVANELRSLRQELGSAAAGAAPGPVTARRLGGGPGSAGRRLWFAAVGLVVAAVAGWWLGPWRQRPLPPAAESAAERAPPSLAVLPFADMSSARDQQVFADGLSEELISALAQIPGLRVVGRTSAFRFRDPGQDLRAIGDQLNVATLLEGSVRKEKNRLRIAAQLVDADDGFRLWSRVYDRELGDVLAIQEDIARSVAAELEVTLRPEMPGVEATGGRSAEAYYAYLEGRYFFKQRTEGDLARAVVAFERALEIDPLSALAWTGLAEARIWQVGNGWVPVDSGWSEARRAASRALALDGSLGEAWGVSGLIAMWRDWDWRGAERAFRRALELKPGDPAILIRAAESASSLGELDEAIRRAARAVALDPLDPAAHAELGACLYRAGRLDAAEAALDEALELNPQLPGVRRLLGVVHLAQARPAKALEQMQRETHPLFRPYGLALAYAALGRPQAADAALAELERHPETAPYQIAEVYAYRGEIDEAFAWLERALAVRDPGFSEILSDALLATLHDDPRWPDLLERLGLGE